MNHLTKIIIAYQKLNEADKEIKKFDIPYNQFYKKQFDESDGLVKIGKSFNQ